MNSAEKTYSVSLDSMVAATSDQVSAHLGEEVVILGFQAGSYFGLDQVGAFVWNLLQEPQKVADIRDAILEEYEVESQDCERDLLALLDELAVKQLIDIKNETDA
jgi:hypothetical protein